MARLADSCDPVEAADPESSSEVGAPLRSSGSLATEVSLLVPGRGPTPSWCSYGWTPRLSCEGNDTAGGLAAGLRTDRSGSPGDSERSSGSFATEVSLMDPGSGPTPS